MKSREEFVRRWRYHLAGLALTGAVSEAKDQPKDRVVKVYEIPGEVERLLGMLYDDLVPKPEPAKPPVNGLPTPQTQKVTK